VDNNKYLKTAISTGWNKLEEVALEDNVARKRYFTSRHLRQYRKQKYINT